MPDLAVEDAPGRWRRTASWVLAAAAAALVTVGVISLTHGPTPAAALLPGHRVDTQAVVARAPLPRAHRAPWVPGAPRRLAIPSLGVDAPVVPVLAPGGTLTPPSDPQTLGWWADGAEPGAARGSALVAGHTVHTGGGALDHLGDVRRGAVIIVTTRHQRLRYDVTSVRVYAKASIARGAGRLFRQSGTGRLVVLTCDGWDGVRYHSNVVVTAVSAHR